MLLSRPLTVALVLGLAVLGGGCDRQSRQPAQPQPGASGAIGPGEANGILDRSHKGTALPAVTVRDPAGKSLTLASLKGKPLLLNLWATWCAPCVAELPTLDKLAATRAADLQVVAVSEDMGAPDKVAQFWSGHGYKTLKLWLDPKSDLAFQFNAGTLPTTIYYDATGRELWRYTGGFDWTGSEAAKLVAEGGK